MIGRAIPLRALLGLLLAGAVATGCKDATLGPDERGAIEGEVRNYETDEAVAGASVTTSPPTEALLTDAEGRFALSDLEAGTYQVSARRAGYRPSTVSVSVRDDRTAQATLVLEEEEEEEPEPTARFEVAVVGFWNTTSGDSTFVETEYRVENTGEVAINAYEVYFRIQAGEAAFFHEAGADSLDVGQSDAARFRVFIPAAAATGVLVDGTWSDPPVAAPDDDGTGS